MNAKEIVSELKSLGNESIKKVLAKHGAKEPFFGVKVEALKKIQKRIKKDHRLALELYDTGISDAMYLAGLIADDAQMTRKDLKRWVEQAYWYMLSEYTVPWVAAGSPQGRALALEWLESRKESIAAQPGPLCHEWVCHRGWLFRQSPYRPRPGDGEEDGPCCGRYGRHRVQGTFCPGLPPEGPGAGGHRQKTKNRKMLNNGQSINRRVISW
jgi:hypothetical protein